MPEALLGFDGVSAGYGEAIVLEDVSFSLPEGAGLAVLGRNGVGKTTLIQTAMGFTRQTAGEIRWRGEPISMLPPHRRARLGLGWVPQERDIFATLTVSENLGVVARDGPWTEARVYELFPRLAERRGNRGDQLSGGEQQMLAIARTLMTNPRLLLLDEPLEGLAPIVVEELVAAIREMVAQSGMTLVLVEQHAEVALSLTARAIIVERGRVVHEAASAELARDHEALGRHIGLAVGG